MLGHFKRVRSLRPTFGLVLVHPEPVDLGGVVEPHVHLDEGFAPLEAEHRPGFGLRQQFRDGALGQAQDSFSEQLLTQVVELQHLLHLKGGKGGGENNGLEGTRATMQSEI